MLEAKGPDPRKWEDDCFCALAAGGIKTTKEPERGEKGRKASVVEKLLPRGDTVRESHKQRFPWEGSSSDRGAR